MESKELIEFLQTRRCIRRFQDKSIEPEVMNVLLETAMFGPTAKNFQPWHFVVVQEKERLLALSSIHPYASMLKYAPAAIIVCGDKQLNESEEYLSLDGAAATMQILLAGHALGLATCWLGLYPVKERMQDIGAYLELPEHILPVSMIALGYPDAHKEKPERFKPERIHSERW